MNIDKAARYLKRINRLFSTLSEEADNPSAIELALMKTYLVELYDAIVVDEASSQAPPPPPIAPATSQAPEVPLQPAPNPTPPTAAPAPQPAPPKSPAVAAPAPPIIEVKPPAPAPKVEVKAPEPTPQPAPKVEAQAPEPASAPTPAPKPMDWGAFAELFEDEPSSNDLQQKLIQSKKVTDLRMAMALNERFLMQNELFGGNADVFNAALDHLNKLSSMAEAESYLVKECAQAYDWLDERRLKKAKRFVSIVRRRYH